MAISHADPIAILRLGLEGKDLTSAVMHASLYPARASVSQVTLTPGEPLALTYFNVAEVQEVKL
jgi:hypothetical protein